MTDLIFNQSYNTHFFKSVDNNFHLLLVIFQVNYPSIAIELNLIFTQKITFFQYPTETYGYAVIFSISGYLGVNVVLTLVKTFGALIAVTGT